MPIANFAIAGLNRLIWKPLMKYIDSACSSVSFYMSLLKHSTFDLKTTHYVVIDQKR